MTQELVESTNDEVAQKLEALIAREQDPFTTQVLAIGSKFQIFLHQLIK